MTDPAETAFRAEVKAWLRDHFPAELRGRAELAGTADDPPSDLPVVLAWRAAVAARGWTVPGWPVRYGGAGLAASAIAALHQEFAAAGAWNPVGGMGVTMIGPTLLEFGTEAQKARHLPKIADGSIRWCQGYSEPGAGSDLAALQCRAELRGDHFLVSGQKVWTSGAQWADWCFALVRTDSSKKHAGISFLLIDMRTEGVMVRPIRLISGSSPFCETFFTDVEVPVDNLVGPLGGGWSIGMRLLQYERGSISASSHERAGAVALADVARRYRPCDAAGRIGEGELRSRIARFEMAQMAFGIAADAWSADTDRPAAGSLGKNIGARLVQERADILIEITGLNGMGSGGDAFAEDELEVARNWLFTKAVTIYGGSTEVQNNIVAKRILGLGGTAR
ncbi:MAG: acyl-CoA dehydrogenase family protein [Sphingobium sp.]